MVLAIKVYEKFKLMENSRKKSVIREIQVLKKLEHRNIIALYDVIDTPKQLYLVMEFARGQMLSSYLKNYQKEEVIASNNLDAKTEETKSSSGGAGGHRISNIEKDQKSLVQQCTDLTKRVPMQEHHAAVIMS